MRKNNILIIISNNIVKIIIVMIIINGTHDYIFLEENKCFLMEKCVSIKFIYGSKW